MEWVETTARTVEEAKDLLLDRLGVHDDEAEFEILEEPKPGLFGRTRGTARVRARVMPKAPRPKDDRRRRPAKGKGRDEAKTDAAAESSGTDEAPGAPAEPVPATPKAATPKPAPARTERSSAAESGGSDRPAMPAEDAAASAQEFVTQLIAELGISGAVTAAVTEDANVDVEVTGTDLGRLIGPRGAMIRVVEELCRTRLQHLAAGGSTPRVRVDVGGYRDLRRSTLESLVDQTIEQVRATGDAVTLDVVLSSERKLVHDRVGETASDLTTRSEGEDPTRRVVVAPAG